MEELERAGKEVIEAEQEMDRDTHVFEAKETFRKLWWVIALYVVFIWVVFTTLFCSAMLRDQTFLGWWRLVSAAAISMVLFLPFFVLRNVSYEVSATKVVKKRRKKTLRTIAFSDIQGIVAKSPVRLKVVGERDFVFEGIGTRSSCERLLSILRELGIDDIRIERKKLGLMRTIVLIGSIVCASHFIGSIFFWIMGSTAIFVSSGVGIDWPMFLHAIPAIVLLSTSIITVVLVLKRRRFAGLVLILTVIISISCCVFETTKGYYQGYSDEYFTWWWYGNVFKKEIAFGPGFETTNYKIGYIDKTGKMVIGPQFEIAEAFSEGMAVVGIRIKNEKFDPNSVTYERDPSGFFPHMVPYFYKYGYIDDTGKIVVKPTYDSAVKFADGLALVGLNGKYGYINRSGEVTIDLKFENTLRASSGSDFSEGLAVAVVDQKYGFIDKTGNFAVAPQFSRIRPFSEGLAAVKVGEEYGYIDKTGQWIIQPIFDNARQFSEGLAAVRINDKWGYIDRTGRVVIEPNFDFAHYFSQELAGVTIDTMWGYVPKKGYIDKRGNIVIEPQYYFAGGFSDGLAYVCTTTGWAID